MPEDVVKDLAIGLFTPVQQDSFDLADPSEKGMQPLSAGNDAYPVVVEPTKMAMPYTPNGPTITVPPRQKPMTDEEARRTVDYLPFGNEQQRYEDNLKLEVYFQAKDAQKTQDRTTAMNKMLTDPEEKKAFYKSPEIIEAAARLDNPNKLWAEHVNTRYIENVLDRPLRPGEYEPAKNALIGLNMAGQPEIDDESALGVLTTQAEKDVEAQAAGKEAHGSLLVSHFEALLPGGKPFAIGETFDKLRSGHADLLKQEGGERAAYSWVQQENADMEGLFVRNGTYLGIVYDYLKRYQEVGATTDEDFIRAKEAMKEIRPEDLMQAKRYLVDALQTIEPKDTSLGAAWGTGLVRKIADLAGIKPLIGDNQYAQRETEFLLQKAMIDNGTAGVGPDGKFVYNRSGKTGQLETPLETGLPPGTRAPTKEEAAAEHARLDEEITNNDLGNHLTGLERDTRQALPIASKEAHPWVDSILNLNEQISQQGLGYLTHASPFIGHLAYSVLMANSYYAQTMRENPGMNKKVAKIEALTGASLESIEEGIKWDFLLSPRSFKAAFISMRSRPLSTFLKSTAGVFIVENVEEGIQDASIIGAKWATRSMAKAIDPSLNVGDIQTVDQMIDEWKSQRWPTAGVVFWMSLIAGGFATHHHMTDPRRQVYNEEYLRSHLGDSPEARGKIEHLMTSVDADQRDRDFRQFLLERTPEEKANAQLFAQQRYEAAKEAVDRPGFVEYPLASLSTTTTPDGKRLWHVHDENGTVVRKDLDAQTAMDELGAYQEMINVEQRRKLAEQNRTEEEVYNNATYEEHWAKLPDIEKTHAARIFDFTYNEQTDAGTQQRRATIQSAVAERNARLGLKDNVELVDIGVPPTRAGRSAAAFIQWYEKAFGKRVQFVASKDGEPLSFGGLLVSSDPNTIFLDATGNRNVLALLGHEWSHSLEKTHSALWADMVSQMKPLIVDWAKQMGKLPAEYDASQATNEFVANVLGDAFANEEFWKVVAAQNKSLFERMVAAVHDWFDNLVFSRFSEWETEAPDVVKDLKAMHKLIAKIMETAQQTAPQEAGQEQPSQAAARKGVHTFGGRGTREKGIGYIDPDEHEKYETAINAFLDKHGVKPGSERTRLFQKAQQDIQADIISTRARNPDTPTDTVTEPWDKIKVTGATLKFKNTPPGVPREMKAEASWQQTGYRFDEIPEGHTRASWAHALATRVTQQFIEQLKIPGEDRKLILNELEWYREFVTALRREFGGAADFMADLLGAFSPQQNVPLNFRNAVDAIWGISHGEYDDLLEQFDRYLKGDPNRTAKSWREEKPSAEFPRAGETMIARSGALFGTNTDLGMTAAIGLWREVKFGDAPKAKNFTRNLIALAYKATVDVWAARLLDRVAEKPRIPVDAEGAVKGAHVTEKRFKEMIQQEATDIQATGSNEPSPALLEYLEGKIPNEGQFAFGQDVFERVAAMFRDPKTWEGSGISQDIVDKFAHVTAADVQATNWFVEKNIWTKRNWTNEAGAGGSFIGEIEDMLGSRMQVGLSQALGDVPTVEDQALFIHDVRGDLIKALPEVISMRVMNAPGMFQGDREESLDLELTHGPGMEPNDLLRIVLKHAAAKRQKNTHASRVMEHWEDMSNARPGMEIYFRQEVPLETLEPIMAMLDSASNIGKDMVDISGFTAIVDPRAGMDGKRFLGIRFQYISEYAGAGTNNQKEAARVRKTLIALRQHILKMDGVAYVENNEYDTLVFGKGKHYDDTGVYESAISGGETTAWRKRYFDSVAQKAVERNAREVAKQHHDDLLLEQQERAKELAAGESAQPAATKGKVAVTMFNSEKMAFEQVEQPATWDLLKDFRDDLKNYKAILECLGEA